MEILHNDREHVFYTIIDGMKCEIDYEFIDDSTIDIYHTFVPEELRGQGIASHLAEAISEYALKSNLRVIPSCSYVVAFYKRNKKYAGIVDMPDNDGSCRIKR